MIFEGIHPWDELEPLVEVRTEDGTVFDLHNHGWFQGFCYQPLGNLEFSFLFDRMDSDRGERTSNLILRFHGVTMLEVVTTDSLGEADVLDHWVYRNHGSRGILRFVFDGGLAVRFECGRVELGQSE